MKNINNETFGISCELAIAECFGVEISEEYKKRGDVVIKNIVLKKILEIFHNNNIPKPTKHVAENQNITDFILENGKTLSVKSNYKKIGKVAPQKIGQATSNTFFDYFGSDEYFINYDFKELNSEERKELAKKYIYERIHEIIYDYWDNLLETDYYIHFFDLKKNDDEYNENVDYIVLNKFKLNFKNKREMFSFTVKLDDWNESTTVKYKNITIGEFQIHKNRNCIKFRFNILNIINLRSAGEI